MKIKILLSLIVVLAISISAYSQTVVVVEPDKGADIGALNKAIALNKGAVIYELKRDAIYYINGVIATTWPLHIRAQAGTGKRPILVPAVDANGVSTRLFSLGGNTRLEGLFLSGRDDMNNLQKNIIRAEAKDIRINITDCVIDYDAQCPIRLQVSGVKAYVKNSILRNIVNVNEPGDGKLIDTRGNKTDSICFDNNTVYHTSDLVARIDGAFVKYFRFDHNTFYLTGDGFDLGIIQKVIITNNIFYNMNWQGSDVSAGSSPEAFIKCDSLVSLDGLTDKDRSFKITNNNIFLEQKYLDAMKQGKFITPVFAAGACQYFIKAGQMDTTKTLHESLTFDNPPPAPMAYINAWHTSNGDLIGKTVPNFYADKDLLNVGGENEFSFAYNTNSKSAKWSTTAKPIGSSRWMDTGIVGVQSFIRPHTEHTIYPNPGQDKIHLSISLDHQTSVILKFYNVVGRQVKTVNIGSISNSNSVEVDISDLANGLYVYSYQAGNEIKGEGKLMINR